MRAVVQRVKRASVSVNGRVVDSIGPGLVVLVGVGKGDGREASRQLADKVVNLRIFEDDAGKMNRSLLETGGEILAVSQFTLYGDCRRGRRPSFAQAAPPGEAAALYEAFLSDLRSYGLRVASGQFQARMLVEIHNDGPVTILLDTDKTF